jgi:hypothetical protein
MNNFSLDSGVDELKRQATQGQVVVLNIAGIRTDAIVVTTSAVNVEQGELRGLGDAINNHH